MNTIILAGGKGTRLQPYTTIFPKPLMPIGQRPILDIIIQQLAYYGFRDIFLSVGYLAELIQLYLENNSCRNYRVNISYIRENTPLGTVGSLASIPSLDETFLVMNGDILTNLDYLDIVSYHRSKGAILTIGMYRKNINIDLGVIETDADGILTSYIEKPQKQYSASMGIYVYEPDVLRYIEPGKYLDFPDLVSRLLQNGEKVVGYPFEGEWLDIGRHEDYVEAQKRYHKLQDTLLPISALSR